uniref:SHSP domain-containing protein n=1 Tax=Steinernema glaseri TaxID=37863 RepID=A0A1I8AAF1_9BILA
MHSAAWRKEDKGNIQNVHHNSSSIKIHGTIQGTKIELLKNYQIEELFNVQLIISPFPSFQCSFRNAIIVLKPLTPCQKEHGAS